MLELKMQLKQKMEHVPLLQLKQVIPKEFQEFINLEGDEDLELLEKSLPFLVLHEVSHPLYDEGFVYIPEMQPSKRLEGNISKMGYFNIMEVGIDKSGILAGQLACSFTEEQMYASHLAIAQRIYRDMFEIDKFPVEENLLARLEAELKMHKRKSIDPLRENISDLQTKINGKMKEVKYRKNFGIYQDLVSAYARVYQGTSILNPNTGVRIFHGKDKWKKGFVGIDAGLN